MASRPNGRTSDAEAMIERFDLDGDGKLAQQELPANLWRGGNADRNGDGYLDADELARGRGEQDRLWAEQLIQNFDKNDDGKLSQQEAPVKIWNAESSDANGDGQLDVEELEAVLSSQFGRGERPTDAEALINRQDLDGDGVVSKAEARERFWQFFGDRYDANGDERLDRDELRPLLEGFNQRQRGGSPRTPNPQ